MKTTSDDLVNLWLTKYHGITVEQVAKLHPDWGAREFYQAYPVTEQQHDEWYNAVIELLSKEYRLSKTRTKREFTMPYLNCAPNVI